MLQLWRRALVADDSDTLGHLAEDIVAHYRTHGSPRKASRLDPLDSWITADLYFYFLLSYQGPYRVSGPSRIVQLLLYGVMVTDPCVGTPRWYRRCLVSGFLSMFPANTIIDSAIYWAGVPQHAVYPVRLALFSAAEGVMNEYVAGDGNISACSVLVGALTTAGFLAGSQYCVNLLNSLGCPKTISLGLMIAGAHGTGLFLAKVAAGGAGLIGWLGQKILDGMMPHNPEELPIDADTPQCLECAICHELLNDPVEVSSSFFCRGCLERWMRSSTIHPYTGEEMSWVQVNEAMLMNYVSRKFHTVFMREYNAEKK